MLKPMMLKHWRLGDVISTAHSTAEANGDVIGVGLYH